MLKNGVDYVWDEDKKKTFQRLKVIFAEILVLKFTDPLKPYILTTDASEYAIGAMLSQLNDEGDEEVIIFISRTFKDWNILFHRRERNARGSVGT